MSFAARRLRTGFCVAGVLVTSAVLGFWASSGVQARQPRRKPKPSEATAVVEPSPSAAKAADPGNPGTTGACSARSASGALRRQSLDRTLDRGLGDWLRGVDIEPSMVSGRFIGWVVRSVYPNDPCYRDLDLLSGDVVTKINGHAIERPEQAHEVWQALRRASSLVVDYRRGPLVRRIEIPIVEQ